MKKLNLPALIASLPVGLVGVGSLSSQPVDAAQLEEVVVTATRRAESMDDVPLAISAIAGDDLTKSGIFSTNDLNRSSPNLQVSSAYGEAQPNFSVRGVGVGTEYNANAASPVGIYVDQVYQTFRASHGQQLYDMEQIEIVRGPQGTLYGRNTTGGAINFITNKPDLAESNGNLTVGVGNYNRRSFAGAYEFTPVADTFGVRLAGTWVEYDPYVDNKLAAGPSTEVGGNPSALNFNTGRDPGGYENSGLRATFRFRPDTEKDFMLKVYSGESDGGTEVPIATGQSTSSDVIDFYSPNFLLGGYFQAINSQIPGLLPDHYSRSERGLGDREVEVDSVGEVNIKADGVVFTADIGLSDNLSFIAVTGYDSGEYHQDPTTDCDGTPLALCTIGYNSDFDAFNLDMRFDYQNGPLKLIVGAFYGEDSITNDNKPNFFNVTRDVNAALSLPTTYWNPGGLLFAPIDPNQLPTGITGTQHNVQDRESWAVYGEANYELVPDVNLTVGLRYSDDTLEYSEGRSVFYDDAGVARALFVSDFVDGNGNFAPYFLEDVYFMDGSLLGTAEQLNGGAPMPGDLSVDGSSDDISGRVILDWHYNDDGMIYVSYSRGYRAGTMNGLSYASASQVYFVEPEEVDAFEVGFKSTLLDNTLQLNGALFYYDYVGQQGQVVDGTATAFLVSLDGEITGAEVDATYVASESLTLKASAGWLDSEYDDGKCPAGGLNGAFQSGNCVASSANTAVNVGGNPFPYAAEFTFNASFDWDITEIDNGTVTLHGDAAYTGQYYFDAFGNYSAPELSGVSTGKYKEGEGEYWTYNARLSYLKADYGVAFWVKNITDEEVYAFGISIENLFGNGYRMIAPPRTFGVEFQYFF